MTVFSWMQQATKEQLTMFLYFYGKEISSKRKIVNFLDKPMTDEMIKDIDNYTGGKHAQ